MVSVMDTPSAPGYAQNKDDYLKRLRRIEGQVRGIAADGRGGQVLHRHPHPGLRGHQGAPGGRARPARRAHGALRRSTPRRPAAGGRGEAHARPPTPSPGSSGPDPPISRRRHDSTATYTVVRHDLRALRRVGERGGPRDRRRQRRRRRPRHRQAHRHQRRARRPTAAVAPPSKRPATGWHERHARPPGRRVRRRPAPPCSRWRSASAGAVGPVDRGPPRRRPRARRRDGRHAAARGPRRRGDLPAVSRSPGRLHARARAARAAPGRRRPSLRDHRPDGHPVTAYDESTSKRPAPDRRTPRPTGFQHVHPTLGGRRHLDDAARPHRRAPGACSPTSGPPAARPLMLGADLAGARRLRAAPPTAGHARPRTVDGYTVTLDGDLVAGERLDAHADGRRRTASRSPTCSPTSAPTATWSRCATATSPTCTSTPTASPATEPSRARTSRSAPRSRAPARYRLFLDFRHGGVVRTAPFTRGRERQRTTSTPIDRASSSRSPA